MDNQTPAEPATATLPPESPQPDAASEPVETPEQLSQRMRKLAQRKRGPRKRPGRSLPAYLRQQIDGIRSLKHHELLREYERELVAELKAAEIENTPRALLDAAVRCRAVYELVESVTFSEIGGPVHRRKRRLHEYVEQRRDVLQEWLSMRIKLGLDKEQTANPTTWSEAFKDAVLHDESYSADMAKRMAEGRRRMAPLECSRAVERENATRARLAEALRAAGLPLTPECAPVSYEPTEDELAHCGEDPGVWDMVIRRKAKPASAPVEPLRLEGPAELTVDRQSLIGGDTSSSAQDSPAPPPDDWRRAYMSGESEPAKNISVRQSLGAPDSSMQNGILELEPEPPAPEPEVEDLGVLRQRMQPPAPQPPREVPFVSDEARPQILRSSRISGTRLYTDDSGFILPNPFD